MAAAVARTDRVSLAHLGVIHRSEPNRPAETFTPAAAETSAGPKPRSPGLQNLHKEGIQGLQSSLIPSACWCQSAGAVASTTAARRRHHGARLQHAQACPPRTV